MKTLINRAQLIQCFLMLVDEQQRSSWEIVCKAFNCSSKEAFIRHVENCSETTLKQIPAVFCQTINMQIGWLRDLYIFVGDQT